MSIIIPSEADFKDLKIEKKKEIKSLDEIDILVDDPIPYIFGLKGTLKEETDKFVDEFSWKEKYEDAMAEVERGVVQVIALEKKVTELEQKILQLKLPVKRKLPWWSK